MPLKLPENRNFFLWLGLGWVFIGVLCIILGLPSTFTKIIIVIAMIIMIFHTFPWTQLLLKELLYFINNLIDHRAGKH